MGRLSVLLALALAAALFAFLWWFVHTPPERVARFLRRAAVALVVGALIYLAATGRLSWIFALIGALIPFTLRLLRILQMLPWPLLQRLLAGIQQARAGQSPSGGKRSRIQTRFLDMTLDHDTGEMDGEILEGRFRGSRLQAMDLKDLLALHNECRSDAQSAAVLEAYLDRMQPDWRDTAEETAAHQGPRSEEMTVEEAYDILGLQPGASREEIIAAHRRLMQKLHPDRGGSDYLAAKINGAKDVLLDETASRI